MKNFLNEILEWLLVIIICLFSAAGILALPSALIMHIVDVCFNADIAWWIYVIICGYGIIFLIIYKCFNDVILDMEDMSFINDSNDDYLTDLMD